MLKSFFAFLVFVLTTVQAPMPVQFYAHFFLGGGVTITEKDLTDKELDSIRAICSLSNGVVKYENYPEDKESADWDVFTSLGRFTCKERVVRDRYDFNYQNTAKHGSIGSCLARTRTKRVWQDKGRIWGNCVQRHLDVGTPFDVRIRI